MPTNSATLERLTALIDARANAWLDDANTTSVGIAYTPEGFGLSFTVDRLDGWIADAAIDAPVTVVARSYRPHASIEADRRARLTHVIAGASICHETGTAGTIGAIVFDRATGSPCALGAWHVLHGPSGAIGDRIVQPGPIDGAAGRDDRIGALLRSHLGHAGDCAIASIEQREIDRGVIGLPVVTARVAQPRLGDHVVTSSRSGIAFGRVRRVEVRVKFDYGPDVGVHRLRVFEVASDAASPASGDSGAPVLRARADGSARDVLLGMVIAGESGEDAHFLAGYADAALRVLDVTIADARSSRRRSDRARRA